MHSAPEAGGRHRVHHARPLQIGPHITFDKFDLEAIKIRPGTARAYE
jgi:hypothetical protein